MVLKPSKVTIQGQPNLRKIGEKMVKKRVLVPFFFLAYFFRGLVGLGFYDIGRFQDYFYLFSSPAELKIATRPNTVKKM